MMRHRETCGTETRARTCRSVTCARKPGRIAPVHCARCRRYARMSDACCPGCQCPAAASPRAMHASGGLCPAGCYGGGRSADLRRGTDLAKCPPPLAGMPGRVTPLRECARRPGSAWRSRVEVGGGTARPCRACPGRRDATSPCGDGSATSCAPVSRSGAARRIGEDHCVSVPRARLLTGFTAVHGSSAAAETTSAASCGPTAGGAHDLTAGSAGPFADDHARTQRVPEKLVGMHLLQRRHNERAVPSARTRLTKSGARSSARAMATGTHPGRGIHVESGDRAAVRRDAAAAAVRPRSPVPAPCP